MKWFSILLVLLSFDAHADPFVGGNPCFSDQPTMLVASGVTSGTSPVTIASGVIGSSIYVCTLNLEGVSGTNPTFSLYYGSGTNCLGTATASGSLTPPWATTSTNFLPMASIGAKVVQSASLCYLDGGTSPIQNFWLSYIIK